MSKKRWLLIYILFVILVSLLLVLDFTGKASASNLYVPGPDGGPTRVAAYLPMIINTTRPVSVPDCDIYGRICPDGVTP